MTRFFLRRTFSMAILMIAVSVSVFIALELSPGNVATMVLGPYSTEEQRNLWLEANGYFKPAYVRYLSWLGNALQGDFGPSIRFKVPVGEVLWPRVGNTAILGASVMVIVIPLSLLLGVLAGMKEGSVMDRTISTASIITTSIPEYASTVIAAAVFVFWLGWLPGTSSMSDGFSFRELILPVGVLVLYDFGYVSRITRASMVEVMTSPYIRTAVLKGLPRRHIVMKHALRNALLAPITIIMLHINWLVGGIVIVETLFGYPGLGRYILDAALFKDVFAIEAAAMVLVIIAVSTQLFADIIYTYLNPRIRYT
ncbi:MAG: ABC transporter permease [SAR324 cluster bacterium]|nr:ABC transporter permease [SAR324 cluster bacterium]